MDDQRKARAKVINAIRRRSFCTVATAAPGRPPHVAGAQYVFVDGLLYLSTLRSSIKARNIVESGRAALCIPVRKLPGGPPFCIHFQAKAELLEHTDAEIQRLLASGALKRLTSHGELADPDNRFVRVRPARRVVSYGVGLPLRELLRDPLHADRSIALR